MSPDKGKRSKRSRKGQPATSPAPRSKDPGPPYVVRWHPAADAERDASWPPGEQVAMFNAVEKLKAAGSRLGHPHSSAVRGEAATGFRELRPRAGRSRWRPIYRQVTLDTFVVLAVAPEAQIDSAGFDEAVSRPPPASPTLSALDAQHSPADNRFAMLPEEIVMKLTDLKTSDELLAEQLASDPAFRAEWERTALARGVAIALVRYRAEHALSQRDLAERLGMTQPQVARLERGDTNPSMETLMRLAGGLDIEFTIDVRPAHTKPRLITKRAQTSNAVGGASTSRAELLVSAA